MYRVRWSLVLLATLCVGVVPARAQDAGDPELTAALQLSMQKKYAEAAPALEKFLAAFPKSTKAQQARLALGESLLGLEKPDAAARAYEAVLGEKPAPDVKAEALLGLSKARIAQKQDVQAATSLTELFEMTGQDPRLGPVTSVLFGDTLLRLGRPLDAVKAFERVGKWPAHAEAPRAYYMVGESYRAAGNYQEAAITLRNVSQKYWRQPFAAQAGLSSGDAFLAIRKLDEAEAEYRRVLKEYLDSPAAPRAQLGLGKIAFTRGNYGNARQAYQAAGVVFAAAGIGPEAELRMADCYLAEQNVPEARTRYQKLIASVDRKIAGEAWYSLAQTYQKEGQLGQAAEAYQKLGGDRTTGSWAHLGQLRLAEIRSGSGDTAAAVTALRAVLADQPEPAVRDEAQLSLGLTLLKRGEIAAANTELTALAERVPPGPFTDVAAAYAGQGRLEQGDAAGAVTRLTPLLQKELPAEARAVALAAQGRAQLQLKQPEGAAALREVLDKHPTSPVAPVAARTLLNYYRDAKQDTQAEALEKLIAQRYAGLLVAGDASLAEANKELAAGRYGEAVKLYQKVLDSRPDRVTRLKAHVGLARAAAALKKPTDVDRELAALRTDGASPELVAGTAFDVASAFERSGDPARALGYYRASREAGPDADTAPKVLLSLSRILSDTGKLAEATPLLDELIGNYPKSAAAPVALYAKAWVHLERRETAAALPLFEKLLALYPKDPLAADAAFRLGEAARAENRLPQAVEQYRIAAASDLPCAAAASYRLGWILREKKDWDGAAKAFAAVPARFPASPLALEARVRAGEAYLELEQDKQALTLFDAVIAAPAADPKLVIQARVGAAFARLMQGAFDEARAVAEEAALPLHGWYGGRAQLVRAEALFLKEGPKAALVEYSRGASLFARYKDVAGEAQFRVGECHEKLGNAKAAQAAWQKVLDLYGDTEWATRSRDRMSRPEGAAGAASERPAG
jgi:TolA-binding protein